MMVAVWDKFSNFADGLKKFYSNEKAYDNLVKYVTKMFDAEGIFIPMEEAKKAVDTILDGKNLFEVRGKVYFGMVDDNMIWFDARIIVFAKDWKMQNIGDVVGYYPLFEIRKIALL